MRTRIKRFALIAALTTGILTAMLCGGAAYAANGDQVITAFVYDSAASVAFSGYDVTITMPSSYAPGSIDLAKMNYVFDFTRFTWVGCEYSANEASIGGSPVSMYVRFSRNDEPGPKNVYTTTYSIRAARVPLVSAQFSGTVEKSVTLPSQSIGFSSDDFAARYTPNEGGPMTGITIAGSDNGVGRFRLGESYYSLGTIIPVSSIRDLRFDVYASGTASYAVYAHNSVSGSARIGEAALRLTVYPNTAQPNKDLDEIYYTITWNEYMYLDEYDFNSVFRSLTGRTLYYVRLSQVSSSYGRLYYNYTSSYSYDYAITSDDRFYYDSSPRISNVAFVPRDDYSGTVTINYIAYDNDLREYYGTVRVRVDNSGYYGGDSGYLQANSVTYNTAVGVPVYLSHIDFQSALSSATGNSLSYIRFNSLPSSAAGRLQYNYGTTGSAFSSYGTVTTDTRYYANSQPEISNISFVPTATYTGTVNVPYYAYAANGAAYGGTLYIRVGQVASNYTLGDINYSVRKGENLNFQINDFQSTLNKTVSNATVSYIMVNELPIGGTLYYNYRGANNYDSTLTTSGRYYQTTFPIISLITFVPNATASGKITIPYSAYTTGGTFYRGKVIISITASGNLKNLSYNVIQGFPLRFSDAGIEDDIRAAVKAAVGAKSTDSLSYVTFKVPASSEGILYKNYSAGQSQRKSIAESEKYYSGSSPSISGLVFTAASAKSVKLSYTAYTAAGAVYEGKITVKQIMLPDSWARDEIESLASRGIAPEALLARYNDDITRAEFTALLMNTFIYSGADASASGAALRTAEFNDIRGNPYVKKIRDGFSIGIIDGVSTDRFEPNAPLTREAAAKILCATIGKITGAEIKSSIRLKFEDKISVSMWALPYVEYANEKKLMIGDTNNRFHPLASISREEAMVLVERTIVKYGLDK